MSKIIYHRNDTFAIRITLRNKATLAPLDLTDKTVTLTVDPSENPANSDGNLMQLTGVVQSPETGGVVEFTPAEGESDFAPGNYWYDIQAVNTSDGLDRQTVVKGAFEHRQDITK